jgi:hypothetical protein
LIHILLLPGWGINGLIPLAYFFSFFLISQMLNLLSASFFAGVRKQYEFICMGFSMYITVGILCISLFYNTYYDPLGFADTLLGNHFLYWQCFALYVSAISFCAYGLILWNLKPKVPLLWKMFRTVFAYTILAGGLYLIRLLIIVE